MKPIIARWTTLTTFSCRTDMHYCFWYSNKTLPTDISLAGITFAWMYIVFTHTCCAWGSKNPHVFKHKNNVVVYKCNRKIFQNHEFKESGHEWLRQRPTTGLTLISTIVVTQFMVGSDIATSGCWSLSKSFADTFWATVCKTVRLICPVCPVCDVVVIVTKRLDGSRWNLACRYASALATLC